MPSVNILIETELSNSARARQLEAMFDVPLSQKLQLKWQGELPIESFDWNVGLIVGPSGAGKRTVAQHVFSRHAEFTWPVNR